MQTDFHNPFANYGAIVCGDRFIGRKEALKNIENRIIRPMDGGNLAIIGLPRIGKSSLAYKTLIERRKELSAQKLLTIWINLATFDQASALFRSLVVNCINEMKELNLLSKPILETAHHILDEQNTFNYNYELIRQFFRKVKQSGYRIAFILDEFDHARYLFKGDIVNFQRLRDLSDNPEWKINFVLTSRRSIRDIEVQSAGISTFDSIFHKIYLPMFNENDLDEYFKRLTSLGIQVTPDMKNLILFFCGGYPYLLGMLAYEIIENFREKSNVDIHEVAHRVGQSLLEQYERILSLLEEDGNRDKLLQILFGPVLNVKQFDVDEFVRYGLIKPTEQEEKYVAFSGHFHTFLNIIEREVDLWPLYRQTEKALRTLITTKMSEKYGDNWIEGIEKNCPNLKLIFDKCREAQSKEEKLFGSRTSRNLLDFTYPQDLFAIIFAEWSIFKPIFEKDKNYWGQRAQLLGKIRTPLAHSRDESLYEDMRVIVEGYCKEVLRIVQSS